MPFSYSLFFALILLFPGFCAWAGPRTAERTDLLTPRPDKPNSTATLFVIVLGTIAGHLLGAGTFVAQAAWCRWTGVCVSVAFDPNVYREVFAASRTGGAITDLAVFAWLLELALVGIAAGAMIAWAARTPWVTDRWDAIDFGWLSPAVREVKSGRHEPAAHPAHSLRGSGGRPAANHRGGALDRPAHRAGKVPRGPHALLVRPLPAHRHSPTPRFCAPRTSSPGRTARRTPSAWTPTTGCCCPRRGTRLSTRTW